MTNIDWTTYTDEQLVEASAEIHTEQERRYTLLSTQAQINALNADYLAASGVETGEPWRQPTGAHDAYPLDWVVTHNGKTWISLVASNVWEPGVSGWREQTEPGNEWPDWVQPTGAHDAYPIGAQVTHAGLRWTSDLDANVWEPGVAGWTETASEAT